MKRRGRAFIPRGLTGVRLPFFIALIVIVVSVPGMSGDFLLDDMALIRDNTYHRSFHPPLSYLVREDGITDPALQHHTGYYRPLVDVTYGMDYLLWRQWAPGYRMTNIGLHLIVCLLLFHLLQRLTGDPRSAFLATLIFAVHPANTEAVSWIVSRNNLAVAFFVLLVFLFFIRWKKEQKWRNLILCLVCFSLALLSKEFAVMVPPVLLLYDFLFPTPMNWKKRSFFYASCAAVLALYFFARLTVTGSFLGPQPGEDLLGRLTLAPSILVWYFRVILLPAGLHNFILSPSDFSGGWRLFSILACGVILLLMFRYRRWTLLLFSLGAFVLFLFPVLNIVPLSATSLVSLRWLYLPLAFLSIAAARLLSLLPDGRKALVTVSACLLVLYLSAYSMILNRYLWYDGTLFFRQELQGYGNAFYAMDYAEILAKEGRPGEAETYYRLAISRYPENAMHYSTFAAFLIDCGRFDEALATLKDGRPFLALKTEKSNWAHNLGVALIGKGQPAEGIQYLETAVREDPGFSMAHRNLGTMYGLLGRDEKALAHLRTAMDLEPEDDAAYFQTVRILRSRIAPSSSHRPPDRKQERHGVSSERP